MKTQDVINHFGTRKKVLEVLNLKARQTIHVWGEEVPELRQYQIEIITNGALKADPKFKKVCITEYTILDGILTRL